MFWENHRGDDDGLLLVDVLGESKGGIIEGGLVSGGEPSNTRDSHCSCSSKSFLENQNPAALSHINFSCNVFISGSVPYPFAYLPRRSTANICRS